MNGPRTTCLALLAMACMTGVTDAKERKERRPSFLEGDPRSMCEADFYSLEFDVRIGWLRAGQLSADICIEGDDYFFTGLFNTGGPIESFIRWNGRFTSIGRFVGRIPRSTAYLVMEENLRKGNSKIVLAAHGTTTVHGRKRTSKIMDLPPGDDLMSALFLSGGCRREMVVHDGEDPYEIDLIDIKAGDAVKQGADHFAGDADRCKYRFTYHTGRVRKIDVWHAQVSGHEFPVRIRIRVPIFPDAVLRLRNPSLTDSDNQ